MEELLVNKKRVRDEPQSTEVESPEVKRLKENLLDSFEDDAELCSTSHDLDLFMKSFEEEITASPSSSAGVAAAEVVDLTSGFGDSRPDLGYLLEASDDELGLPLTASNESKTKWAESVFSEVGGEFWEIPSHDLFDFGFGETENYDGGNGEYAPLDELFDYSDLGFGSSDFLWRPETLPAQ